ncbi:helix-turn-helix transcriptional regulator [Kibdelosporangium aridum]|uniref:helix-turn-helix transcriptional regulator n=1 Tax=Kibdelosporangium aridum TaxID=2030 RepID=UPI0035E55B26
MTTVETPLPSSRRVIPYPSALEWNVGMGRFGWRVDVIGRQAELDALSGLFDPDVSGVLAVRIEGEPGVGKSTLWREGVTAALTRSYEILACAPTQAEAKLSFAALADLLEPVLGAVSPELPAPQRRALDVALLRVDADEPADERAVSFAFLSALRIVACSAPVLLAIDDTQWLDGPSARVVEFALRRLDNEHVRALTSRHTGTATLDLERDLGPERVRRISLAPLSLAALHQLLARTGVWLPRRTLLRIQDATAGNVFYAQEIARVLASRDEPPAPSEPLPVPATLNELVARRVSALSADDQGALLAASALVRPTPALISAVDPKWPPGVLDGAQRAGLIEVDGDWVGFGHPLIASAVYRNALASTRRGLHRRLSEVVTDPEERARHMALGADGPDETVAAALDVAAVAAHTRGAPAAAAELSELARDSTPSGLAEQIRRRTMDAAEHHFVAGDRARARLLLDRVLPDCPSGPEAARALRLLGQVRYHDDSFPEAARLLRLALAEAATDDATRAAIDCDLAFVVLGDEGPEAAAAHARSALAAAERVVDTGLLAETLAAVTMADFLCGRGLDDEWLARALDLEDPGRRTPVHARPSLIHGMLMAWVGRPEPARVSLEALRARLIDHGEESGLPFLAFTYAFACCWRGELDRATWIAEEGMQAATTVGTDLARALGLTAKAVADAYHGHADAAVAAAGEAVELFTRTGRSIQACWPLTVLGFLYLSVDDAPAADRVLRPLTGSLAASGLAEPTAAPFLPDAVEALVALGELDLAEKLLATLQQRLDVLDRPWAMATGGRCRALVLAARGDLDGALSAIDGALRAHERLPHPVELGRTLLVHGQLLRRANRRRHAHETIEQALVIFERTGAKLWAARSRAELTRLGLRRTAGQGLTPREEEVARRAATGATNTEIAAAMYISPKTVEANLARVYRKLGIRSRAELGWHMAERSDRTDPSVNS